MQRRWTIPLCLGLGLSVLAPGIAHASTFSGTISCGALAVLTEGRATATQRHTTTYNITWYYSGFQYRQKNWGSKPANQSWVVYSPNSGNNAAAHCV